MTDAKTASADDQFLSELTRETDKFPRREGARVAKEKTGGFMADIDTQFKDEKKQRTVPITFHAPEWISDSLEKHMKKLGLRSRSMLLVKILEKVYSGEA